MVFRLRRGGDHANRPLLGQINHGGRVFLSSTGLDNQLTLPLCVLSHRTHREHVDEALRTIRTALPDR